MVAARHSIHVVDLHLRRDPALLPASQPGRLARTRDLLLNCTDHCPHRRVVQQLVTAYISFVFLYQTDRGRGAVSVYV